MIAFFCPGKPQSQGSKVANKWGGMREANKELGPWRERVALAAHAAMAGQPMLLGPVVVAAEFVLPRPKSAPKRSTPPAISAPDVDKCLRAILDSLTAVCYPDDARVITALAHKRRAEIDETPGVHLRVGASEEFAPANALFAMLFSGPEPQIPVGKTVGK